jgi:hypothetical protein
MQNNASASLSFERIETRLTRPAHSGRAGLIWPQRIDGACPDDGSV